MDQDSLLLRNLKALNIIGMWSPETSKFANIYNIYSNAVFIWFCCFTTSQFVELYYVYGDFKELTSNAGVSLLYAVAISKVWIFQVKKEKIMELVDVIRQTEHRILQTKNNKMKKVVQDYILQNWDVSKKFWLLTFCTILGFFVRPTIESILIGPEQILLPNGTATGKFKHPLVFSSWFPFDKYNDKYYYLAYGLQTISGTIGASYLAIWDTFIVALMIFAIGQFKVLQCLLRDIYPTHDYNEMASEEDIDEELYMTDEISVKKRFVDCVKQHNMVLKYVKDLDVLISPVMFLDFVVCSLMLCAIGLEAIMEGLNVRLVFTIEYLISMLIQLFMFYWYANEIMLESLKVCNAAWDSRWYDCNNSVKNGLILLIMRAQRPCTLTAGNFYTMSLQTFLQILKTSYSYMALLRQTQN